MTHSTRRSAATLLGKLDRHRSKKDFADRPGLGVGKDETNPFSVSQMAFLRRPPNRTSKRDAKFRCNKTNSRKPNKVHRINLRQTKTQWVYKNNIRHISIKSPHKEQSFSNAKGSRPTTNNTGKPILFYDQPNFSLLAYSDHDDDPTISGLQIQEPIVHIPGDAFWPIHGPENLHPGHGKYNESFSQRGHSSCNISRRFISNSQFKGNNSSTISNDIENTKRHLGC